MTVPDVATFNVNQFDRPHDLDDNGFPKRQAADLRARMERSRVVLVQESVAIDLVAFAATVPGWGGFQIRHGDNDGHANTGVLYRLEGGPITDTDCTFLVDTKGERRRFLAGVEQGGVWYWSAHINPKRFSSGIPTQLAHIGAWVKAHPGPQVGGLDRNQCPPGALENATGLKWHGVGIDGFLTNLPMANIAAFPDGFSDHPGVHAAVALPDPPKEPKPVKQPKSRLRQILADLRAALAQFKANDRKGRAKKAQAAIDALKTKPQPKPTPTPAPAPTPAPTPAPAPVPDVPKSFPAIAAARKQSHEGPQFGVGECLMRVRMCYGIAAREPVAATAWRLAKVKHPTTNIASIPRGYPVFWTGGSKGFGHIAIAAGDGNCWSTDIERPGFFDYVPIAEIHTKWGLTLVGWTEDINGVTATITK